ncbi:hypothetical protein FRB90_004784, partial [Tulasnella sp. 427]
WLQDKKSDAENALRALSNQSLWLNIDSTKDDWSWKCADELVFNVSCDAGGRSMVKGFLLPYRSLLVEVGAHEFIVTPLPVQNTPKNKISHSDMVRLGWEGLRKSGQLLDVCFKVQGAEILAHRGMLAAMVPHFQTAFGGSFRESLFTSDGSDVPIYRLPEEEANSLFAVQSVVEANGALEDLLDLMELSNLWDIPELTDRVVEAISHVAGFFANPTGLNRIPVPSTSFGVLYMDSFSQNQLNPRIVEIPEPPLEFGQDGGKFYRAYDQLAEEIDEDMVKSLKGQLDGILIFAGLFAGVNTAFLALTLPLLSASPADDANALLVQNNAILMQLASGRNDSTVLNPILPSTSFTPSTAIFNVNVLFSLSLAFTVMSSFLAVLGRQWLVYYRKRGGGGPDRQRWEQLRRFLGAQRWSLELMLDDILPALLQISLVIFCASFILYLGTLNTTLSKIVVVPLGLGFAFFVGSALCTLWDRFCPFHSPLSHFLHWSHKYSSLVEAKVSSKLGAAIARVP